MNPAIDPCQCDALGATTRHSTIKVNRKACRALPFRSAGTSRSAFMRASMKDHVRDALLTVALFGGIGVAFAQSSPQPKVPGHDGLEEPTVKQAPKPGAEAG